MAVNGIELKVGQVWKTRGGRFVEITEHRPYDLHPWVTSSSFRLTDVGRTSMYTDSFHDYAPDLIELISEAPATPTPEPDDAAHQAVEMLTDLGWVFTDGVWVQETPQGYDKLADVLARALAQASQGKGKERHATGDTPFEEQPMATINRQLGSVHGYVYQAHKKSLEAMRLPAGRDVAELLGAINYLAGAVIALESWARKGA